MDQKIQFTIEESSEDGSMPFLDMLIIPKEDGRFNTTIYRKPTHADMYLQWDSQHPISSKYSVVGTSITEPKQCLPIPTYYIKKKKTSKKY